MTTPSNVDRAYRVLMRMGRVASPEPKGNA